jgi:hypothetical protein
MNWSVTQDGQLDCLWDQLPLRPEDRQIEKKKKHFFRLSRSFTDPLS